MSRYTDIDFLMNNYQTICSGVACMDCPFNDEGCQLEKMLLESPTADVVPVMHGHWIWSDDLCEYCCSRCGHTDDYGISPDVDYCPYCGALMDEGMNDTD